MKSPVRSARRLVERVTGWKIYRSAPPRGFDLFRDLNHVQGWGPPKTVFDVGAHVGATIDRFKEAYPVVTVHAFEPASDNLKMLRQRFARDPHVNIHAIALGSTNRDGTLHLKKNTSTHSVIPLGECLGSEPIQIATMDTFCERERLQRVNYCKIDTEGGDLEVLRGASTLLLAQRIDFVQVETSIRHDTRYFAPLWEIDGFLNEKRYELFGFYDQEPCHTGRDSLLYFNAVYIRSSLVEHLQVG